MIHPRFRFLLASLILPIVGIAIVIVFASRRTPAGEGRPTKTPEPAVVGALTKQPAGGEQLPPEVMRKLSDLKTRADTVRLLGEQKDRRAVSHLRSYCSDPDTTVRLNSIWAKAAATAEMREKMANTGAEISATTPEHFAAMIRAEVPQWRRVITDANLKLE